MILSALLALGLAGPGYCSETVSSDSLTQLYQRGRSFSEFLSRARARRETWLENSARATVPPSLLERARAVPGSWRLLVVAEDWCGDSANTIPYIARLVDSLPAVQLRIVDSRQGRWVMERHRTPDGRAATPTIVLLDSMGVEAGCFVERPAALRALLSGEASRLAESEQHKRRDEWRRADAGQSTVREIVELLEGASQQRPRCEDTPK